MNLIYILLELDQNLQMKLKNILVKMWTITWILNINLNLISH